MFYSVLDVADNCSYYDVAERLGKNILKRKI